MKVSYYRGLFAGRLAKSSSNPGGMIAVSLSATEVLDHLDQVMLQVGHGKLSIACINSPTSVTVSGDKDNVDALDQRMGACRIFARKLPINVAYHSSHMEAIAAEYATSIADIHSRLLPLVNKDHDIECVAFSSVTGDLLPTETMGQVEYWVTNLVSQVRFSEALSRMCDFLNEVRATTQATKDMLLEVGPHAALQRPVKDTISALTHVTDTTYDSILKRNASDHAQCLALVARLHCLGYKINLARVNSPLKRETELSALVDLPQYAFNHSHTFWYESRVSKNFRTRKLARHELLGTATSDWNPHEPKWRNILRYSDNAWLQDHKVRTVKIERTID